MTRSLLPWARRLALLIAIVVVAGCAQRVTVRVPPALDLTGHGVLGVIDFVSNAGAAVNEHATRQFQAAVQAAQPGTRLIELGGEAALLAAIGAGQLDANAFRKIGEKYGVEAVFQGRITYSDPETRVNIRDVARARASARRYIQGDIFAKLVESSSGASIWSNAGWVRQQTGGVSVNGSIGVAVSMKPGENPRYQMVPGLVALVTQDLRPTFVRQR